MSNWIVIVDDEEMSLSNARVLLGGEDMRVSCLRSGRDLLKFVKKNTPDLILLDVLMPDMDGFDTYNALREYEEQAGTPNIPVIFLTARSDLEARLQGLTGGAEDYIVKPFDMPELLVRMDKVLARRGSAENLVFEAVRLDPAARNAWRGGEMLTLTPMEFDLLALFLRNPNLALSREHLLNEVWGIRYEGGTRTVDVHVAQLRRKTGLNLVAVPKIGYRLEANP